MDNEQKRNSIDNTFNFLITVDIILSTAIILFADKTSFIPDRYQNLVTEWYFVPFMSLILSFVCYQMAKDKQRDAFLNSIGIRVLRFENKCVWNSPEGLLDRIKSCFTQV
jgi:hypothetical protein